MPLIENIYEKLTNEENARLCDDIPSEACSNAPRGFVLILISYLFTKLGDAIASPKTTLAWVATAVGAPAFVLGFLVPIRESGSMIPQLFIGGTIRRLPIRKWVWVAGSVGQGFCIAGIGLVAFCLEGATAGWCLLGLIAVFSLARGLSSVAAKDVLGKTIPKPRRGQLTGWSASIAGLLSVGVGILLMWQGQGDLQTVMIGVLLLSAGALWWLAAWVYAQIPEIPGATEGGRSALEALSRLRLLVTDRPFRRFVLTRALLMCSALSAPFYIAQAQDRMGSPAIMLGAFVAAAGVASLVSGPFWGRFADRSSRSVMVAAAYVTAGIGLLTFGVEWWVPALARQEWFLPVAYFILSIAHSGVRVGRKTYVVNLASGNLRTDYVAISNTTIGVLLLLVGSVGLLTPIITPAGIIGLLALMGLAGAWLGRGLPEVE